MVGMAGHVMVKNNTIVQSEGILSCNSPSYLLHWPVVLLHPVWWDVTVLQSTCTDSPQGVWSCSSWQELVFEQEVNCFSTVHKALTVNAGQYLVCICWLKAGTCLYGVCMFSMYLCGRLLRVTRLKQKHSGLGNWLPKIVHIRGVNVSIKLSVSMCQPNDRLGTCPGNYYINLQYLKQKSLKRVSTLYEVFTSRINLKQILYIDRGLLPY